jgi:type IV pilus assembly protein PilE
MVKKHIGLHLQKIVLAKNTRAQPTKEQDATWLVKAFSLAEILIVLAIMGILIMLVVPNQAGVASRTKSLEAQQELKMVQNLQYAYFLQFSKYAGDLQTINYIPHKTVLAGGTANYEISIVESSPTGFMAKAEAVQDFDGDGTKNSWEIDQDGVLKEIQPD